MCKHMVQVLLSFNCFITAQLYSDPTDHEIDKIKILKECWTK